jgi:hypothetical protein
LDVFVKLAALGLVLKSLALGLVLMVFMQLSWGLVLKWLQR